MRTLLPLIVLCKVDLGVIMKDSSLNVILYKWEERVKSFGLLCGSLHGRSVSEKNWK